MRCLFDEQLNEVAAQSLNVMCEHLGHGIAHIVDLGHAGMQDEHIPALCASMDIGALITMNVKDFGAKKVYLSALLEQSVHVAVVRPGKQRMDVAGQIGFIAPALPRALDIWHTSSQPQLLVVRQGGAVVPRTLDELVAEFEEPKKLP